MNINTQKKSFALLIDPDKQTQASLDELIALLKNAPRKPDVILVGGSLVFSDIEWVIQSLKNHLLVPVYLFPGSVMQLSDKADGLLLLSLISGRNPEFLIGQQVMAAPAIRKSGLDVISTGYILIDGGVSTSVGYMSGTQPIPANKPDIVVATAMAGELLGLKALYLEAGSGALNPVNTEVVSKVREQVSVPLIVGGGIKSIDQLQECYQAGADMVVVGTAVEHDPDWLLTCLDVVGKINKE